MTNAYVKWKKAVVNTPLEYPKLLPGSSLANVPPKVRVVKHLPGEHDQSTHTPKKYGGDELQALSDKVINVALKRPGKFYRVRPGLYYASMNKKLYVLEHVTKAIGFSTDEWHLGTEDDPHADQYTTRSEAMAAWLGNYGLKHLQGQHDQSTHGSWAIKPAAPPNYTAVGTLTPLVRNRGPIGPMTNHIMDTDGYWYASPKPRPDGYYYHHTELYAMYALENKKDFKDNTVTRAQEILDQKIEEDARFEDEIMGEKDFISIATSNWQGLTPYKIFTMKVSNTSPIGVLNRALHLLQRQVERGNINPLGYRSFYIVRNSFHDIKPGELETIAGFDSEEGIIYKEYKHLPGEHDQKTHTPKQYGGFYNTSQSELVKRVDEASEHNRAYYANMHWETSRMKSMGYTREQYDKVLASLIPEIEKRASVTVGISSTDIDKIFESGEIQGREVTGATSGTFSKTESMNRRQRFDEAVAKGKNFIYGIVGLGAAPYGDTALVLDNDVLERAFVTRGDTLDQVVQNVVGMGNDEAILAAYVSSAINGKYAHELLAQSLLSQSNYRHAINETLETGKVDEGWINNMAVEELRIPYIEVQMMPRGTGLPISKIRSIYLRNTAPNENTYAKFGVPIRRGTLSELLKFIKPTIVVKKHLPGQHDQKLHTPKRYGQGKNGGYTPGTGDYAFGEVKGKVGGYNLEYVEYEEDPKLNALLNNESPAGYTWSTADKLPNIVPGRSLASLVKENIVENLAEKTGLDKELTNRMVHQWAETSNDNDVYSLSIQEAASEEFGLPLSNWQQKLVVDKKSEYLDLVGDTLRPEFGITSRENERKFLRAIYDETQAAFAKQGLKPDDMVTLYRGLMLDKYDWKVGQVHNWKGNAIESWSISRDVADGFAIERNEGMGLTMGIRVPVSSIFSTARTGTGCLGEGEFIIFGNIPGQTAKVLNAVDFDAAYGETTSLL